MEARAEALIGARVADIADTEYRNTLAIATLIELLVEKGVITAEEVGRKSEALDRDAEHAAAVRLGT